LIENIISYWGVIDVSGEAFIPERKTIIGILTVGIPIVISIIALLISIPTYEMEQSAYSDTQQQKADTKAITNVIEKEASLVLNRSMDQAISLYTDNASIRDYLGQVTFSGKDQIADRYNNLEVFTYLQHQAITVAFSQDGSTARAIADTVGTFIDKTTNSPVNISSNQGERWTLEKINGEWKITSLTYNLP